MGAPFLKAQTMISVFRHQGAIRSLSTRGLPRVGLCGTREKFFASVEGKGSTPWMTMSPDQADFDRLTRLHAEQNAEGFRNGVIVLVEQMGEICVPAAA